MSTPAPLAAQSASSFRPSPARPRSFQRTWWRIMGWRVGILPLPVYLTLLAVIVYFLRAGRFPTEIAIMMAVLAVGGFTCAEIGRRIPLLQHVGGAAILAALVPSALTYYHVIPVELVTAITGFLKSTYFYYVFITVVVAGSILGMDRAFLISGFIKMFVPMAIGSILAAIVGLLVGPALGLGLRHTFYYIVIPVMSGGLSEGAIPLSLAYSDIKHLKYDDQFAQIMPVIMIGSITAIVLSGVTNFIGVKYPRLSGGGSLQRGEKAAAAAATRDNTAEPAAVPEILAALSFAVALYVVGMAVYRLWGWPAPLTMLFLAIVLKLARAAPPALEAASHVACRFFTVGFTFPVLFAFGVAMTPWDKLIAVFTPANIITIASVVVTMMTTGFVVARWIRVYPIEMTILNACRCSHGTAGDVAILTAANRIEMMPFAQIATRIGGLITVTLALIALKSS